MNPNGNQGHQGSGIDPNDDPNDPKTWPPGVKKAPDFGFLDPNGLWIPTPFDVRTGGRDSKWTIPQTSPANIIGIPASKLTPFQQKTQELGHKNCCTSASHLEQTKVVQLPNGAPQIPGYKQVDAKRFATDMKQSWGPNDFNWQYAYKNGNKFVLIVPWLWYNTKISIGRYYSGWNTNLRYDQNKVNTPNGVVYVAAKKWVVNDMFLDVIIHSTDNIGDKILANIKI